MKRRAWIVAGATLVVVVALAVVVLGTGGGQSRDTTRAGEREAVDPDRAEGYFDPRKEAKFERAGGEADRKGPDTPAAEQVDNRAYPRTYVDDRRAAAARVKFNRKAKKPGRPAYDADSAYQRAVAATPGAWTALGPVTANVPGASGQFWDPATETGPATQESGRVTALAIDPNCGKPSAPS